jgi:hypothetical protein
MNDTNRTALDIIVLLRSPDVGEEPGLGRLRQF